MNTKIATPTFSRKMNMSKGVIYCATATFRREMNIGIATLTFSRKMNMSKGVIYSPLQLLDIH